MNEAGHGQITTGENQRHARFWPWVLIVIGPRLIYFFSVGPFVRWRQSARTRNEYWTRVRLERDIYAPLIWLDMHDPTRGFNNLTRRIVRPWEKPGFNWTALPEQ